MAQLSAQLSTTAFNTTDVPLGPGGTFVPTQFEDVSSWNTVTVAVVADAPSAASGLVFQWSADGVTVDIAIPYDVIANVPRIFDSAILMKFFRVIYTNGGFAQTRFNVLTVYRYSSSVTIRDILDGEGKSIVGSIPYNDTMQPPGDLAGFISWPSLLDAGSGQYVRQRGADSAGGAAAIGLAASVPYNLSFGIAFYPNGSAYLADGIGAQYIQATSPFLRTSSTPNATAIERTPAIFRTVQANAAGNTVVWTPPVSPNQIRLMRYMITVTGNASQAVAGVFAIDLNDAGASLNQTHDVYVPAVAPAAPLGVIYNSGWIDLGNGPILGQNNVLNVNLSAALVTGSVRVIACGTEE